MKRSVVYSILMLLAGMFSRAQDADTNDTTGDTQFLVHVSSSGKDRVAVGGTVNVKEDEVVKDVVVVGGSATINGKVSRDVVVVFGTAKIGPKAHLSHDLIVVMGSVEVHPDAVIKGEQQLVFPFHFSAPRGLQWLPDWVNDGLLMGRPLPPRHRWAWIIAGTFLAFYALLALLFPGPIRASVATLETRPGSSLLTGLLAFLLIGPLLVLLLITVIGSILVPFLICGSFAAYFFGKAVVYGYTGRQLGGKRFERPLVPVIIGTILFCVLYAIPFLGFLVWGVAAPLGVGAVLLAFFSRIKTEKPPRPPVQPLPSSPPPAAFGTETAPAASLMSSHITARAGFWLRLFGTIIDAILLGVVLATFAKFIRVNGAAVILIWTVYHIFLWGLKGATIGGMVVGTRILRADGAPIDFSVAVVRSLASFLSAAALLLGFFWAGWSASKQSWHDIIAGTLVVKTRPVVQSAPLPAPASQ